MTVPGGGIQVASLYGSVGLRDDFTGQLRTVMGRAESTIQSAGRNLQRTGAIMSAAITAPLVGIGGVAASAAIGWESAFAGVRKTVDASETELAALEVGLRNLATADMSTAGMANAQETLAGIAEAAGQLGVATPDILDFTEVMANLGMATNMTAQDAAVSLAQFANITGMEMSNIENLGSTVVALGNNMATTESDIVNMSMRLAGISSSMGLNEAQIMGLSAAMSSVGIQAEAGGTAMTQVISAMIEASAMGGAELETFAEVSGYSMDTFRFNMENVPMAAISNFIRGLGEMDASEQIHVLDQLELSGVRVSDTLRRLSGNTELFFEAGEIAAEAWAQNTALTNEAAARYATTEAQMNRLKNTLRELGISIGNILLPALNSLLDFVTPLVGRISQLDPVILKTGVAVAALAAAAGPLMGIFGTLMVVVGGISAPFLAVAGAVMAVAGALRWLISNDVGGLGTAFRSLGQALGETGRVFGWVWETIGRLVPIMWEFYGVGGAVRDVFVRLATGPAERLAGIISGLAQGLTNFNMRFRGFMAVLNGYYVWFNEFRQGSSNISRMMGVIRNELRETSVQQDMFLGKRVYGMDLANMYVGIQQSIEGVVNRLKDLTNFDLDFSGLRERLTGGFSGLFGGSDTRSLYGGGLDSALISDEEVQRIGDSLAQRIGAGLRNTFTNQKIGDAFSGFETGLQNSFSNLSLDGVQESIQTNLLDVIGLAISAVGLVIASPVGMVFGLGKLLASAIENDFLGIGTFLEESGITPAVEGAFHDIVTTIEDLAGTIFGGKGVGIDLSAFEGIFSALETAATNIVSSIGTVLAENIGPGLADLGKGIMNFIRPLLDADWSGIEQIVEALGNLFGALIRVAGDLVGGVLSGLGEALGPLGEALGSFVSAISALLEGDFGGFLTGIGEGLTSIKTAIENFATGVLDGIINGLNELMGWSLPDISTGIAAWQTAFNRLGEIVDILAGRIRRTFDSIGTNLAQIADDVAYGILMATPGGASDQDFQGYQTRIAMRQARQGMLEQVGQLTSELNSYIAQGAPIEIGNFSVELPTGIGQETFTEFHNLLELAANQGVEIDPSWFSDFNREALFEALRTAIGGGDQGTIEMLLPLALRLDPETAMTSINQSIMTLAQEGNVDDFLAVVNTAIDANLLEGEAAQFWNQVYGEVRLNQRTYQEAINVVLSAASVDASAVAAAVALAVSNATRNYGSYTTGVAGYGGAAGGVITGIGSFANGGNVAYDQIAMLHAGERVQTADEVRRGAGQGTQVFNINSYGDSPYDLINKLDRARRKLAPAN